MAKNKHYKKKVADKIAAKAEIKLLFNQARSLFKKDKAKANNLVRKLRRITLKHRLRLDKSIKRSICKHCHSLLVPGTNLRVRLRKKHNQVVYYCLECKKFMKFGYGKR